RRVPAQAGRTWPGPTGPCVQRPPCRRPDQPIRTRQCTADILSHQCRHPQWRWAATFGASPELHECATRSSVFTCRKSPYSSRTTPAKYLTYREKSALAVVVLRRRTWSEHGSAHRGGQADGGCVGRSLSVLVADGANARCSPGPTTLLTCEQDRTQRRELHRMRDGTTAGGATNAEGRHAGVRRPA